MHELTHSLSLFILVAITQLAQSAALRIVADLGIFEYLARPNKAGRGVTATQLAAETGAAEELISTSTQTHTTYFYLRVSVAGESLRYTCADINAVIEVRLMRVIVSLGLCSSSEPEVYTANDQTVVMIEPAGKNGVGCM